MQCFNGEVERNVESVRRRYFVYERSVFGVEK